MKKIFEVFSLVPASSKHKLIFLYFIVAFSGLAEIALVGSLVPTIAILFSENIFFNNFNFINNFTNSIPKSYVFITTCLLIILTGALRYFVMKFQLFYAYRTGHELSKKLYELIINSKNEYFSELSRDRVITTFSSKIDFYVTNGLLPTFILFSSLFMLIMITIISLIIAPIQFLIVFFILVPSYIIIVLLIKKRFALSGNVIDKSIENLNRSITDTLETYRELILGGNRSFFKNSLIKSDLSFRLEKAFVQFYTTAPKFILETSGMVLVLIIAYYSETINTSLSATIALAIGLQRALPYVQQGYNSWGNLKSCEEVSGSIIQLFNQSHLNQNTNKIHFLPVDKINLFTLQNVSLKKGAKTILDNFNLAVKNNQKIAIVGKSGSGKSTLLDCISGFTQISDGEIRISSFQNKKNISIMSWQSRIMYLSQKYPLGNMTIKELVAFPSNKINKRRVIESLKQSEAYSIVKSLKYGIDTPTSFIKSNFSGGEIQRIQLSRVFYSQKNILLLDECTSALDYNNAKIITKRILSLKNKTVIFVTHDNKILKYFNFVISLD